MAYITQTELINADIEYGAKGVSNKDYTQNVLREWRGSQKIKDMKIADKYFSVDNTEIDKKTRSYKDEAGKIITNDSLSNVKSKTAQYRKSVNQKLNFALANPFIISCDNDNYKEAWEEFLTDDIRSVITRAGLSAINKGIGYSYPWINEKGDLRIVNTPAETIYPDWTDVEHTELDALVRDYSILQYTGGLDPVTINKVEFWDRTILERYIDTSANAEGGGDLIPDTNGEFELGEGEEERATIQQTHLKTPKGEGVSWERVPFIFFKGCVDELPLLSECKTDIDSYDMVKSKAIDSILDDIDAVLIVEGISAEMGDLTKARKMVQNSRIMAIDIGGKAWFEKVNTDISSIAQELEIIKKDIQDNTNTVDVTTIQLGTNPSGQAMKTFYEPLNTWCNGFESQFRVYMKNLKYFFDKWLSWKGGYGTFEQLQDIKITFTLDRDMMMNETETLENITKMADQLSQQTLDEINPWVENPEKEQKRREEEEKELMEKQELYQFENLDNENDNSDEDNENNNKNNLRE